jgi:hypothetical protein
VPQVQNASHRAIPHVSELPLRDHTELLHGTAKGVETREKEKTHSFFLGKNTPFFLREKYTR